MSDDIRECVVICEGRADKIFLDRLFSSIGVREYVTIPFHEDDDGLYGVSNFGRMIEYVKMSNPAELEKVKLFLFVTDSANDPEKTFYSICSMLRKLGLPVPDKAGMLSKDVAGAQQTLVILLPEDSQPGCLETLYYRYLKTKYKNVDLCHESFISCLGIDQTEWNIEKKHKSLFHATVAATFKTDPSRSASTVFNKGCLVNIEDATFKDLKIKIMGIFTVLEICNAQEPS